MMMMQMMMASMQQLAQTVSVIQEVLITVCTNQNESEKKQK